MADRTSDRSLSDLITGNRPVNPYSNTARAILEQGLLMGWGDEGEAWFRSTFGNETYENALADIRDEYGRYAKEHGVAAPLAEFAGAAIPAAVSYLATVGSGGAAAPAAAATTARTAGALSRIAQGARQAMRNPYIGGAVTGATQGAITGAGSAEEGQRTGGALVGGAFGSGVGVGIPVVFRGAPALWKWGRERLDPSDEYLSRRAAQSVNEALKDAGMTPFDAEQSIFADRAMGLESTLADVSGTATSLAETAAQRSGRGPEIIEKKLYPRLEGTKDRTYARVRSDINKGNYFRDKKAAVDELRQNAQTIYDDAFFNPDGSARVIDDPNINSALNLPYLKDAYKRGKRIAELEAESAKRRGEDPSRYVLPDIYESVPSGQFDPITNAPIMVDKLSGKPPTVRTLDYVKRGLDDIIGSAFTGQSSVGRAEASVLKKLRDDFVSSIDDNIPEYRTARNVYKGDLEVGEALDSAYEGFSSMAPEEVAAFMDKASPAEREAFKSGAVRHLYDTILNTSSNKNAASQLINNRVMSERLRPLFDSPAQFDLFKAALLRESQLHKNAQKILQGAASARRIAANRSFEQDPGIGAVVADAVSGGFMNSVTLGALRFMRSARMNDEKAAKVADLLMSSDPSEVAAAVDILERESARTAGREVPARIFETGTVGGVAGAFPEPPPSNEPVEPIGSKLPPEVPNISEMSLEQAVAAEEAARKAAAEDARDKKRIPGSSMVSP